MEMYPAATAGVVCGCAHHDVLLRRAVNWGGAAALAAAWMAWPAIDKDFKKDLLSGKVFKKDEDKK